MSLLRHYAKKNWINHSPLTCLCRFNESISYSYTIILHAWKKSLPYLADKVLLRISQIATLMGELWFVFSFLIPIFESTNIGVLCRLMKGSNLLNFITSIRILHSKLPTRSYEKGTNMHKLTICGVKLNWSHFHKVNKKKIFSQLF
jgi:hypothetical protein